MKHLRYDIVWGSYNNIEMPHPVKQMEVLGITYQHRTPQSMGEEWWFWNCENIPDPLPPYLTVGKMNPMECIGYGLSEEEAISIRDYKGKGNT